jgi:hypothetical protein
MTKIDKKETLNKWTIKNINKLDVLHYFDAPVDCIYRIPVMLPHPSISGQAVITRPICASNCPMFDLKKNGLFNQLEFKCTKTTIDVYMDSVLTDPKNSPSFLIS